MSLARHPTVALLSMTAVKGFGLRHPRVLRLTAAGAVGDRAFVVADDRDRCLSVTVSAAFLPFWAELDFVGIQAYFPLTTRPNGTGRASSRATTSRAWPMPTSTAR